MPTRYLNGAWTFRWRAASTNAQYRCTRPQTRRRWRCSWVDAPLDGVYKVCMLSPEGGGCAFVCVYDARKLTLWERWRPQWRR
jgi:hypothetical protein